MSVAAGWVESEEQKSNSQSLSIMNSPPGCWRLRISQLEIRRHRHHVGNESTHMDHAVSLTT
jgi:hypothetical protein